MLFRSVAISSALTALLISGSAWAKPPTASFPLLPEALPAPAPAAPTPAAAPSAPSIAAVTVPHGSAAFPSPTPASSAPPQLPQPREALAYEPPPFPKAARSERAAEPAPQSGVHQPPEADRAETRRKERQRDAWLLSVEGVTRAPVDFGVQAGVELPLGLRLFGGAGWVPAAYSGLIANVAASFSPDARVQTVLEHVQFSGNTWHLQAGLRPFDNVGVYFDAGYTHVSMRGLLDLSGISVPNLPSLAGGYDMDSSLDMWQLELGYQAQIGGRVVLAAAVGAMGTLGAQTTISASGGAPSGPELQEASEAVDVAFESYGVVPTLTLRLGFDLI